MVERLRHFCPSCKLFSRVGCPTLENEFQKDFNNLAVRTGHVRERGSFFSLIKSVSEENAGNLVVNTERERKERTKSNKSEKRSNPTSRWKWSCIRRRFLSMFLVQRYQPLMNASLRQLSSTVTPWADCDYRRDHLPAPIQTFPSAGSDSSIKQQHRQKSMLLVATWKVAHVPGCLLLVLFVTS